MKKTITVSINEEKLSAIVMYLGQKDTTQMQEIWWQCSSDGYP